MNNTSLENTTFVTTTEISLIKTGFIFVHGIGIILCGINIWCLKEKIDDVAKGTVKKWNIRRFCHVRKDVALNILFMYHVFLFMGNIILGITCDIQDSWNPQLEPNPNENLVRAFWLSALANYVFLAVLAFCLADIPKGYIVHSGLIFEFLHLLTFWISLLLMLTCAGMNCSGFQNPMKDFIHGYAAIPMLISYGVLFLGGWAYSVRVKKIKVISAQEAVTKIKEKLHGSPAIEWTVVCGNSTPATDEEYGIYLMLS